MALLPDPSDVLVPPDAPGWIALERTLAFSRADTVLAGWPAAIIGTLPLGVDTPASDVDIAVEAADLDALSTHLRAHWPMATQHRHTLRGQPCLVFLLPTPARPLELFASPQPLPEHWGYRHFRLEARLLRLLGAPLRQQVQALRAAGLKTEPAFAAALGLVAADPYAALLVLEGASDLSLMQHSIR
jgi:hypothetical protein